MSNAFTLDALREETIARFEPTRVTLSDGTVVELKSILRVGQKAREAVIAAVEEVRELNGDEFDDEDELADELAGLISEAVAKIFRLIASKPKKLLAELDHEDAQIKASLHTAVLTRWIGESQLGEAVSSPS
ncbi:tail assembly chaperone [Mycobacterium phage Anthony]|uniref:Tail assembly chaperone n=1 Tax=Mycobacterium phage Anthony TaxID=2599857 RepID=A0A5J6TI53_9CAUD|nr:tail assembly chaperone [Mycobacterium phage Anthony]QFG10395.1 tail assembly chaperone [Mycobacterium phage Anthony]